ncbi:hypothetical protein [Chryseobacterium pennipullorum]|uniref:Uncharacterized protein n=1 Tax=Chryseobacterium pennipullorum TaxID=2258963 RepID=A0A3D9B317_9FLAO|nr:hypothetical protein [Chryseobacterium pennipullorum]REC48031.1 hypothetical protein DRF67_09070 [Chryseobacterium pennipullorum]
MGIFDFFKKKNNTQENSGTPVPAHEVPAEKIVEEVTEERVEVEAMPEIPVQKEEEKTVNNQFEKISTYKDYIVYSIALQLNGDFAPISAFEKESGEVEGFAYMITDPSYGLSAQQVIDMMEEKFENELKEGKIKSYAILYHSQFDNDDNHNLATTQEELKAITLSYHFNDFGKGKTAMPYIFENENISFKGFAEFSHEENNSIISNQLTEGKDYFTNREEIKSPEAMTDNGIKITKSNTHTLGNMWGGIFGYESIQNEEKYTQFLKEIMALCMMDDPNYEQDKLKYTDFKDVKFKVIPAGEFSTIYPEVKTDFSLDFETKEISEWENVNNIEAIVGGPARDTFGVWFFATDYAENKNRYLTESPLNVNISAIVFALDIHKKFDLPDGTSISEEFTTYMPSKELPNYACFDFIGELVDFRETELLDDGSVKGYILKLKLITNEEIEDFFTIDAFVSKENMRFDTLTKGMKLMGALQLQGKISG